MTTTSGGNVSVREENGDVWITPARVDKGALDRDGHRPRARRRLRSRAARGLVGIAVPPGGLPGAAGHPRHRPRPPDGVRRVQPLHRVPTRGVPPGPHVCGEAACAYGAGKRGVRAETSPSTFARARLRDPRKPRRRDGRRPAEAFQRFETLEFTAKTIIKARMLGEEIRYLTAEELALPQLAADDLFAFARIRARRTRNGGRAREFVRRAYRQRLFISTQGSFSARLDGDSFLITSTGVDRGAVEPDHLALVARRRRRRTAPPQPRGRDPRRDLPPAPPRRPSSTRTR